jgi:hypothetical protein
MKGILRAPLLLFSTVTIADIVVVHWILRRHRLYRGRHVLLAERSLLVLAAAVLIVVLRCSHPVRPGVRASASRELRRA